EHERAPEARLERTSEYQPEHYGSRREPGLTEEVGEHPEPQGYAHVDGASQRGLTTDRERAHEGEHGDHRHEYRGGHSKNVRVEAASELLERRHEDVGQEQGQVDRVGGVEVVREQLVTGYDALDKQRAQ